MYCIEWVGINGILLKEYHKKFLDSLYPFEVVVRSKYILPSPDLTYEILSLFNSSILIVSSGCSIDTNDA